MNIQVIHPRELAALRTQNDAIELIDVRTPAEFREVHVAGARNIPLDQLDPVSLLQGAGAEATLHFICRTGSRARQACERMLQAGATRVANVEGGTLACIEAGLPVVRGARTMSLERQVRIAAGSLVVAGCLAGWLIHPALFGIAAFIGAGLVFAGVTDTCGMGMVLARMPWNRVSAAPPQNAPQPRPS